MCVCVREKGRQGEGVERVSQDGMGVAKTTNLYLRPFSCHQGGAWGGLRGRLLVRSFKILPTARGRLGRREAKGERESECERGRGGGIWKRGRGGFKETETETEAEYKA